MKNRTVPIFSFPVFVLAISLVLGFSFGRRDVTESILREIPVQSGGRVKPFDSFAREALISVTGKTRLDGEAGGKPTPTRTIWDWIARPDEWHTKNFLPVRHALLAQEFSLMVIDGKVSPEVVLSHAPFQEKVQSALEREGKKERLTFQDKKRIELYDQARLFQAIAQGALPGFFPDPQHPERGWIPLSGLADPETRRLLEMRYGADRIASLQASLTRLVQALRDQNQVTLPDEAIGFRAAVSALMTSQGIVLDPGKIKAELLYNQLRPFRWTGIFYLAAALFWFLLRERKIAFPLSFFIAGFIFHTGGFVLRCYLAGRPPVSNMYESVIWVAWGAVTFSGILGWVHRKSIFPAAAAWVASFMVLIGESFPTVLDPSLAPLVPVLRNNYWLTVHVLTITLSYGALALAWGMAHVALLGFTFHPEKKEKREALGNYVYRAMQVGVVLLAAGTILGGVWANDSWGRFWGWDPKETWALIALLGYLVVLHARFARWIGSFGTCLGAAIAFLGIVMAWYGVNFVLAAGLHSYGFGGGGLPYVLTVAAMDLIFISFLAFRYNSRKFRPALSQARHARP